MFRRFRVMPTLTLHHEGCARCANDNIYAVPLFELYIIDVFSHQGYNVIEGYSRKDMQGSGLHVFREEKNF